MPNPTDMAMNFGLEMIERLFKNSDELAKFFLRWLNWLVASMVKSMDIPKMAFNWDPRKGIALKTPFFNVRLPKSASGVLSDDLDHLSDRMDFLQESEEEEPPEPEHFTVPFLGAKVKYTTLNFMERIALDGIEAIKVWQRKREKAAAASSNGDNEEL